MPQAEHLFGAISQSAFLYAVVLSKSVAVPGMYMLPFGLPSPELQKSTSFFVFHAPTAHPPIVMPTCPPPPPSATYSHTTIDLPRRPIQLLPLDREQLPGRDHGQFRDGQSHVSDELEGFQGSGHGHGRAEESRKALLRRWKLFISQALTLS